MEEKVNVVTLGGGDGHSAVLNGLSSYSRLNITAICTVSDSGNSTGVLSQAHGQSGINGSLGDVSKCMCALASSSQLAGELLFRFPDGPLHHHSLKNVLFAGLILQYGPEKGLCRMHELLGLGESRKVYPASFDNADLWVELANGRKLKGESRVDTIASSELWDPELHKIKKAWLMPEAKALPRVIEAIQGADFIVLAPGDLFTSLIPALLVKGVAEAIKESRGTLISVLNLMTKPGETDGYSASDFVRQIFGYTLRQPDIVICNNNGIPTELLLRYEKEERKVRVVADDLDGAGFSNTHLIRTDLWTQNSNNHIIHDSKKTANALLGVFC